MTKSLILIFLPFLTLLYTKGINLITEGKWTDKAVKKTVVVNNTLSIVAVGDIMLGSAYPSLQHLPPDDAVHSFKHVSKYLRGDVVFGNIEGCFLDAEAPSKCKDPNSKSCYAFKMPERYAAVYKAAGFNVLSIANNHISDFGAAGRKRTAKLLDSLQINYAGLLSKPFALFKKGNIKYAFCAFAPNANTVSLLKINSAKKLVATLKQRADIVIVSFHGGAEGISYEHVTRQDEIYFGENRGNVYAFAHAVIDAGADIVLGHGPHVTRAVEVYKNKFIAYGLGNFCTYGRFDLRGLNGVAPLMRIKMSTKGDFISADVVSTKQDKIKRLKLDPAFTAFKRMQYLTNIDFPENNLVFTGTGSITLKK